MIRNIFITTFRNLYKHKAYTLINILGLALGFMAFILVSIFIEYEYSWDKHNKNYDRIYRVQRHFVNARHAMDGNDISPHTVGLTAKLLSPTYPEIEKTLILRELEGMFLSSDNAEPFFDSKEGISAEPSILEMFTYDFIEGDQRTCLTQPNSIVLSEKMAKKLFPNGNALGKTVLIEKKYNMLVTGIYRDLPTNSILKPSYIVSLTTLEKRNEDVRNSLAGSYMTYVLLRPNQDVEALNKKIWDLFKNYPSAEFEKIKLCPLSRLYLSFNGQKAYLTILTFFQLIGFLILILSAFNYINLTTANASIRSKEIGIHKVHGGSSRALMFRFMGETLLLSIIALEIAFFFIELFLPIFSNIVQKPLVFSYTANWYFTIKIISVALFTGILAGIYPAFFMSSQKVLLLFKSNIFKSGNDNFSVKKLLVTFQFAITMILVITSLIISLQIKYLLNKDLGFEKDNILYATINVTRPDANFELLKSRFAQHPEIINCCMSLHVPFVSFGGGTINWEGCQQGEVLEYRNNTVSYDFIDNYKIQIVEGRGFSRAFRADEGRSCLINETAKKCFGFENPIGKRLNNGKLMIVGVMKDYHYKDMYNFIEPAVITLGHDEIKTGRRTFSFRIKPGEYLKAKQIIQSKLEAFFPNDPFEVKILEESFKSENVFKILGSINNALLFFTILNILLASIGLLGLVAFTTQRRTKEIGIRKINGSSTSSIFLLLIKEYLFLLFIASLISWPIGYLAYLALPGNYKVPIPYEIFVVATLMVVFIAIAVSFFHTIKAAKTNPIEALRYE